MEITDTNLDNIIYENIEEILNYSLLFGENHGYIKTYHKITIIDLDHIKFNINVMLNPLSINSYIFNKDNYFYKFFNKFINNKYAIKDYIIRLKNFLFDDLNLNKKNPIHIIEIIRNYN